MGWKAFRQSAVDNVEELATAQGKNTLVFYLVSRFIAVVVAVVIAESAITWLENVAFLPALQALAPDNAAGALESVSFVTLARWAWVLLASLAGSGIVQSSVVSTHSVAVALALVMLILLLAPVFLGALAFATMIERKIRALQEQRERELVQIAQQRSQFMTDIAHDLRTPLMAISGMSHALVDGIVRDEAQREEYLQAICDKSDKMGTLVNAVFDYSKLGGGSFELNREVIDLSQLVLGEAAIAYADAEDAGMMLTTFIPEERCAVLADSVQLARVVANLIANAIRHNDSGVEISVLLVRQPGSAFVLVADTGEVMPGNPEDLFRPFAQGDAARAGSREGSGLGLSICKRVADMHGYNLSVVQPYGRFTKAFALQCAVVE